MAVREMSYDSSRLSNREKMLICNFKGVLTKAHVDAFANLFGTDDIGAFQLSTSTMIKAREKLKKELRK